MLLLTKVQLILEVLQFVFFPLLYWLNGIIKTGQWDLPILKVHSLSCIAVEYQRDHKKMLLALEIPKYSECKAMISYTWYQCLMTLWVLRLLMWHNIYSPEMHTIFNSSPAGQNGRHFADDIFRCIFLNETFCILIEISLKFVPKGPIDIKPALV